VLKQKKKLFILATFCPPVFETDFKRFPQIIPPVGTLSHNRNSPQYAAFNFYFYGALSLF